MKRKIAVYMKEESKERLTKMALENKMSVTDFALYLMNLGIKEHKKRK